MGPKEGVVFGIASNDRPVMTRPTSRITWLGERGGADAVTRAIGTQPVGSPRKAPGVDARSEDPATQSKPWLLLLPPRRIPSFPWGHGAEACILICDSPCADGFLVKIPASFAFCWFSTEISHGPVVECFNGRMAESLSYRSSVQRPHVEALLEVLVLFVKV